jgi:hypothetical protein
MSIEINLFFFLMETFLAEAAEYDSNLQKDDDSNDTKSEIGNFRLSPYYDPKSQYFEDINNQFPEFDIGKCFLV